MKNGSSTKKRIVLKQNRQKTQTDSKHTQVKLCVEPEFMENVEEYLNAITPQKTSFQIVNETSETEDINADDKLMSL